MTDTELLDRLEEAIREYGAHNIFMVSRSDRLIAVEVQDTSDAQPATSAHATIRGVIEELVTKMKRESRGILH